MLSKEEISKYLLEAVKLPPDESIDLPGFVPFQTFVDAVEETLNVTIEPYFNVNGVDSDIGHPFEYEGQTFQLNGSLRWGGFYLHNYGEES